MKHFKLFFCFLFLITSLSCSKNEEPLEPELTPAVNKAPDTPLLKFPQDGLQCSYYNVTFEWEPAEDPEEGEVRYELEISRAEDFWSISMDMHTSSTSAEIEMESGTLYYWRVRAIDERGFESEYSKIRSLSTEPTLAFNNVPFPAYEEEPANNALTDKTNILLTWSGKDSDGDELSYDLYFDTSNPPDLYKEDLEDNVLEVPLEKGTTYYWKVNVKDGKGAKAIGNIWTFTTPD